MPKTASLTAAEIRRHALTPWNLPAAPGDTLHPAPVRRAMMNAYADLQILKLKVTLGLLVLALVLRGFH